MASKRASKRSVPDPKPGTYADGRPLDQVQYLECKIILKPDRFTSSEAFWEFAKVVRRTARKTGVGFSSKDFEHERPQIREVVFLDTADFRLYNNAFILRRRIPYRDGFPVGDPEIVFKFRHPELQKAARTDVRPRIAGSSRIKFKAEALPLKDQVGALRMLYSHNVEFPLSHAHEADRTSMDTLARVFPPLARLRTSRTERVELVNQTIVEEVLQDIGMLDFGKGIEAKANVALWRARGDHLPLVGEFAFQIKFKKRSELRKKAMKRAEQFFVSLQHDSAAWLLLGATKTGVVYRLKGNPPQAHE
ncbi:MAG TPA: hypothetical protein VFM53_06565 [Anaeromyxobacteraceae bacterium]|nr:hypothetical protein [Anaeromyxobacteraceae bacterium]